jgi:hypothetical protein
MDAVKERSVYDWQTSPAPPTRQTRSPRLLRLLVLVSSAALLSTFSGASGTLFSSLFAPRSTSGPASIVTGPADEWRDDVWPLRELTPWDISTDFPYNRILDFEVTEGTWLRLDVHPKYVYSLMAHLTSLTDRCALQVRGYRVRHVGRPLLSSGRCQLT